jgi:ParB-like chromosome segregation protein Spo0J
MKIEQIKTEKLIPYARNSRLHSQEQIAQISASIREFGFNNPVLIDKDHGIIAGHGRVLAAQKLGLDEIPCLRLSHLTDIQKRAYIIADNRLAETGGGWDTELLALEIEDLRLEDFDIDLTGFDAAALASMFDDVDELDGMPDLPEGDKEPFQQMTFTLHDEQAEQVSIALKQAKSVGEFVGSLNENSNGNALARICETYLTHNA